jgi:hypothetical protein
MTRIAGTGTAGFGGDNGFVVDMSVRALDVLAETLRWSVLVQARDRCTA